MYILMTAWCQRMGIEKLLTAHTADDQAETVAMRMKRTSSAASLAGIWPEAKWHGIGVVRPLLSKRRSALRNYLRSCSQQWIEDESNADEKFERVRIRNAKPNISLAKQALVAQKLVKAAKYQAEMWADKNLALAETGMIQFEPASFAQLSAAARDQALQKIIRLCAGSETELAKRAAATLLLTAPERLWRRCGATEFEEIGVWVKRWPSEPPCDQRRRWDTSAPVESVCKMS